MTTTRTAAHKLTAAQATGLRAVADGGMPHGNVVRKLTDLGLIEEVPGGLGWERQLTIAGREVLAAL